MAKVKKWRVVSGTITRPAGGPRKGRRSKRIRHVRGDVFAATDAEVRNCLDQVQEVEPKAPKEATKPDMSKGSDAPTLTPRHRGGGRYDVVDQDGNPINDDTLSKAEAEEMCR